MNFWKSVGGMVEVCLTCADLQGIIGKVNQYGITLYDLQFQDELTCYFQINRTDFRKITVICGSYGAKMEKRKSKGVYWTGKGFLARPVLLSGFLLFLFLVLLLPTRVLFVRVDGNETVPDQKILEAAESCGIRFGASRRQVRSEKVKNALVDAVPQLQWAGINTKGCVAVISVRERTQEPESSKNAVVSSIVSSADGYILSATATRGTLVVQPGQTVTVGQTLISGYSDLGIVTQSTAADGEIYAQTNHLIKAVTPSFWNAKQPLGDNKQKITLLIGKKRINLWKDSGISGITCGRMYEEYYITLPGNFVLPLAVCVEVFDPYVCEEINTERYTDLGKMEVYAADYLKHQMIAGQIFQQKKHWSSDNDVYVLQLECVCREMIGRQRQEQIGDIYE